MATYTIMHIKICYIDAFIIIYVIIYIFINIFTRNVFIFKMVNHNEFTTKIHLVRK